MRVRLVAKRLLARTEQLLEIAEPLHERSRGLGASIDEREDGMPPLYGPAEKILRGFVCHSDCDREELRAESRTKLTFGDVRRDIEAALRRHRWAFRIHPRNVAAALRPGDEAWGICYFGRGCAAKPRVVTISAPLRSAPLRSAPFRSAPFRSVPFRSGLQQKLFTNQRQGEMIHSCSQTQHLLLLNTVRISSLSGMVIPIVNSLPFILPGDAKPHFEYMRLMAGFMIPPPSAPATKNGTSSVPSICELLLLVPASLCAFSMLLSSLPRSSMVLLFWMICCLIE
mmetsp:Transcript_21539/g.44941  ORF Transcript_21539/g.44941 Transcript_21539/m.44941 type:complete len:284 (-) Transcript_21539:244-1095(-)